MAHDEHHEHLIKEVGQLFEPVLSHSPQAIYIYLDDTHKICNQKFADLLGYSSIEEWVANETPIDDVIEEDRNKGIEAYGKASENLEASSLNGTWKTKDGSEINTEIIMVPFAYKDEVFVVHFISKI